MKALPAGSRLSVGLIMSGGGARAATVTITFLAPNQRCGNVASLFGEPFGRLPER